MSALIDVIIPVYNEEKNLLPLVRRLADTFRKAGIAYHLYIVDDHSTDKTARIAKNLVKHYPLTFLKKQGERGKAYSILEGAKASTAPYLVMIDADLQYPPEVIPQMLKLIDKFGVVVARRNSYDGAIRRTLSRGFQWFFGKVLHGLDCDVQSGLKLFKREIIENVDLKDVTAWTLDIPLLTTALNLGFPIGEIEINFAKRENGESKIRVLQGVREIGTQAVKYKLKQKNPVIISPTNKTNMVGAGLIHKGHRFVTHTTLAHNESALRVITPAQKAFLIGLLITTVIAFLIKPWQVAIGIVGVLSFIYFADMAFNLLVVLRSLVKPPEIQISPEELEKLKHKRLPIYTVLCPLYKEAHVLPQFVSAIEKMDWPKNKLDVILLLEADDQETVAAAKAMRLPKYITIQVVPDSQPKTKPKACNYGLSFAKGEYLVIYDAEDTPDPLQLKKVYAAFQKVGANVKCIQAKLNFYNPHQNLLTRFFTAEYSLWFDVVLTGLQSVRTSMPLGGTSNHFRTQELKDLQGWDPFNVTEDADLGIRLFKRGALTAIIDSVTLEEANSSWRNWLRQRSRWIKGYMQTYLVHMRNPIKFFREYGWHAFLFQLTIGGKIAFMLINPLMWLLTITYFGLYAWVGPAIESLFPSVIFYMAVSCLIFGNFLFLYYYMIGAAKREHWSILKWTLLIPLYWLMVSVAAAIALYQLVVKPHYWEKTVHGLHLQATKELKKIEKKTEVRLASEVIAQPVALERLPFALQAPDIAAMKRTIGELYRKQKQTLLKMVLSPQYRGAFFFVLATMAANVLNMLTNLYLGTQLSLSDFAILNTFISLSTLVGIFTSGVSSTINHKTALMVGKHQVKTVPALWEHLAERTTLVGLILSGIWLVLAPFTLRFLQFPSLVPIITFVPFLLVMLATAVNSGYLRGTLRFDIVAIGVFLDPVVRLALSIVFGYLGYGQYIYITAFLSAAISWAVVFVCLKTLNRKASHRKYAFKDLKMPMTFFVLAILSGLASIAFFSIDNLLVVHFLGTVEAGKYGLLGLLGKMVYFSGGLVVSFVLPLISYKEGKGEESESVFIKLFLITLAVSLLAFVGVAIVIPFFMPFLIGDKIGEIRNLLPVYAMGVLLYTLSQVIVQYHLAKRNYVFSLVSFLLAGFQILVLFIAHASLVQFVIAMSSIGLLNLAVLGALHLYRDRLETVSSNVQDFLDLFARLPKMPSTLSHRNSYRILMFNWRDTQHKWAGGAESYMQEMAQQFIKDGHSVTIFCGNDGHTPRSSNVDGVNIIRRGGFYTVYIWAAIYYLFRFRNHFDFVIDSENGVPFLTPLYVRVPIFLLIHHVHQEVFLSQLPFPLSTIASIIEADIMPLLYKHTRVITVSPSSKEEILALGMGSEESIGVINPGIAKNLFASTGRKTKMPTLLYFGRLKPYKNVDIALKAFAKVLVKFPSAKFTIAGSGESLTNLKKLAKKLNIQESVVFLGSVTDLEKPLLYTRSWVVVQPSMIEGWGITVIEANAGGTPVVASNVKGLRDSIRDQETGLLVEAGNIDVFAAAIEELFAKPMLRRKFSRQAIIWAKNYTWDKSYEKLWQFIRRTPAANSVEVAVEAKQMPAKLVTK